jgi:CheY-like chemotaxis protein
MSLSYGIIQEHGGTITASSQPGDGATFVIELPLGNAGASTNVQQSSITVVRPGSGHGKHILVVDDEEGILDFISEVLTADGYHVDTVPEGEAALRHLREKQYDVTLCDWKMPGMNGQQLYNRIAVENREASQRFVFMTGDVINERMEAFLNEQQRPCLPKPFSVNEFRAAVANLAVNPVRAAA